jgi:hypothetical protein
LNKVVKETKNSIILDLYKKPITNENTLEHCKKESTKVLSNQTDALPPYKE